MLCYWLNKLLYYLSVGLDFWRLNPIRSPETPVNTYQPTLSKTREKRASNLHRAERLEKNFTLYLQHNAAVTLVHSPARNTSSFSTKRFDATTRHHSSVDDARAGKGKTASTARQWAREIL